MDILTQDIVQKLSAIPGTPSLSLYMPAHRSHPENRQDPIRFQNLVEQLRNSLLSNYEPARVNEILAPFYSLQKDAAFWNHTLDGVAALSGGDGFHVFTIPFSVPELAIVADSLHIKPLAKYLQTAGRYRVLAIDRTAVRLYEGNRHKLVRVPLHEQVPGTITEALGAELTDKHLTVASYGGAGRGTKMYHGHGSKKDEVDKDTERFFRVVASAVQKHHSAPDPVPLVLAALPEYHNIYQQVADDTTLLPQGIAIDPHTAGEEKLAGMSWEMLEPYYTGQLQQYAEEYNNAAARGLGSDNIEEIVRYAAAGRVALLLASQEKILPGKITDAANGVVEYSDINGLQVDDLIDDMAALAVKNGGKVIIVPAQYMPSATGVAAIYRY